jgi:hypothetical protein
MDQLIAILMNPDSQGDDLVFAAHNLTRWGPAAAPAVPGLRRALRYPYSYDARLMAAEALAAIGPAAKEAIPELVEALKDKSSSVRDSAAYALGSIGEPARCTVPELAQLLWDPNDFVRISAAGAIDVIAGVDLVRESLEPRPSRPIGGAWDEEEEIRITAEARSWWTNEGQYVDWSSESDLCPPSGS